MNCRTVHSRLPLIVVIATFTSRHKSVGLAFGLVGIVCATSATPAIADLVRPECLLPNNNILPSFIVAEDVGCTPDNPLLPDAGSAPGIFEFPVITPRRWYDPPYVSRYDYSLASGLFLSFILPPASGSTIDLYVGDSLKASDLLGDGSTEYFFSALAPSISVTSFSLRDITPLRDAADPTAFPVFLDFTLGSSGLTITPRSTEVPGPLPVLGGLTAFALSRRVRGRIHASSAASR